VPTLLHLDSAAETLARSRSRSITKTFADEWSSAGDDFTVIYRDLHADPLPHLPDAALHWPPHLRPEGAEPPLEAEQLQAELIGELLEADVLLVSAPIYNYSVPSALKAWVDHIHVPGITAPFELSLQPLADRPAVIVSSRGGIYDEGSRAEHWDHAVPMLEIILGNALGMTTEVITTSATLAEDLPAMASMIGRSREELAAAHDLAAARAREIAATF